ncbi:MAG: sugar ABC transporter substrate-binding protein [Propionicimonas sp.]
MKKSLLAALLAAGMMFTAACSSPATPTAATSESAAGGGKVKIAYVVKAMSDQFWIEMKAGADKAAAANNVELSFQAPEKETDVEKQIQMVENAIASKVNAIILSAADSKALIPSIVKANQASIPVVLVNDTIDNDALTAAGGKVVTYVGIDQYASAKLAGDYAVKNIKQGNVVLLEGISGVKALADRLNGFKDAVEAAGTFKIVASQTANNDRAQAFNVMQNILTSNKEVDVVWAINAEMGQGAVAAIQQSNYGRPVSVFDFDASADDVAAIKAGTLAGSVAQFPELQAEGAIKAALEALAGKTFEAKTQTKAELITKENVEAFAAARPQS